MIMVKKYMVIAALLTALGAGCAGGDGSLPSKSDKKDETPPLEEIITKTDGLEMLEEMTQDTPQYASKLLQEAQAYQKEGNYFMALLNYTIIENELQPGMKSVKQGIQETKKALNDMKDENKSKEYFKSGMMKSRNDPNKAREDLIQAILHDTGNKQAWTYLPALNSGGRNNWDFYFTLQATRIDGVRALFDPSVIPRYNDKRESLKRSQNDKEILRNSVQMSEQYR
jgi:tetratricopeptide (TPR) repeat protein